MAKAEGRGIQSIEVGNRLLMALMRSGSPMMLRDLAAEVDIGAAQAHAYLSSFRRTELVEQEANSGRYILGPATNRLAMARMGSFEPMARINRAAPELARSLGVLVTLVVWGPQAPTAYQVHDSGQGLNINLRPGTTFSVMSSASGRVFAAYDPSPAVEQRIQDEIAGSVARGAGGAKTTKTGFARSIAGVRRCGYALLMGSPVPELGAVSAPVMFDQKLALAVTLVGPSALIRETGPSSPRETLLRFASKAVVEDSDWSPPSTLLA